jgi:hypothetical protein
LALPASRDSPHTDAAFSGTKKIGSQASAISAASSTFFGPSAASITGMRSRTGVLISFSGLPRPVPSSGGSGIEYFFPWWSSRSRRHTWRQMSTISRVRCSGAS